MKIELNVDEEDIVKYIKKFLIEDLEEYENHILLDVEKFGNETEINEIKDVIEAYKTVLRVNYRHVPNI